MKSLKSILSIRILMIACTGIGAAACTDEEPAGNSGQLEESPDDEAFANANCDEATIRQNAPPQAKEMLDRAFDWVRRGVDYCQCVSGQGGGYRTDCSGYISFIWDLGASGQTTYSFAGGPWDAKVSHRLASYADLQIGDALNFPGNPNDRTGHIMLFAGWLDSSRTRFCAIEERRRGTKAAVTVHAVSDPGSYWGGGGTFSTLFLPIRRNGYQPTPGGGGADIYVLSGDWNGDGVKTPGFYNARTFRWQLSDYNQSTGVSYDFGWGGPGFLPVVGDWDGDGKDTPGLYNPTTYQWHLSNRNSAGGVDLQFGWGGPGFIPVVGDWNGDGKTTPGLYNPTTFQWHLSNRNSAGGVDFQFGWGGPGFIPVVGDWNGDGTTTPGLYNPTTYKWHLSNRNSAGGVDYQFGWGGAGTLPLSGDWDKNGSSTPGLFEPRSHQWTLSNVNAAGGWAAKFGWGGAGSFTVVGGPVYTAP